MRSSQNPPLTVSSVARKLQQSRAVVYSRLTEGESLEQIALNGPRRKPSIHSPCPSPKPRPTKYTLHGIPTSIASIARQAGITKAYAIRLLNAGATPEQLVEKQYRRPREYTLDETLISISEIVRRSHLSERQVYKKLALGQTPAQIIAHGIHRQEQP